MLSVNTEPRVKNNNQSPLAPLFLTTCSPLGSTVHHLIKLLHIMLFKVLSWCELLQGAVLQQPNMQQEQQTNSDRQPWRQPLLYNGGVSRQTWTVLVTQPLTPRAAANNGTVKMQIGEAAGISLGFARYSHWGAAGKKKNKQKKRRVWVKPHRGQHFINFSCETPETDSTGEARVFQVTV